jgi:hypothetical protein
MGERSDTHRVARMPDFGAIPPDLDINAAWSDH